MPKPVSCNDHFFDYIDSELKAYLLGFIFADGCNYKELELDIELRKDDVEILQLIKKALSVKTEIRERKTKNTKTLKVFSKYLGQRLSALGLTPRKTFTLCYPDIPKELNRHFIRGYLDGNGTVSNIETAEFHRRYVTIIGTPMICAKIAEIVLREAAVGMKYRICSGYNDKNNKVAQVSVYGVRRTKLFLHYLCDNSNYSLSRKRTLINNIFNEVRVLKRTPQAA